MLQRRRLTHPSAMPALSGGPSGRPDAVLPWRVLMGTSRGSAGLSRAGLAKTGPVVQGNRSRVELGATSLLETLSVR